MVSLVKEFFKSFNDDYSQLIIVNSSKLIIYRENYRYKLKLNLLRDQKFIF